MNGWMDGGSAGFLGEGRKEGWRTGKQINAEPNKKLRMQTKIFSSTVKEQGSILTWRGTREAKTI